METSKETSNLLIPRYGARRPAEPLSQDSSWHLVLERLALCWPEQLPKTAQLNVELQSRASIVGKAHSDRLWHCSQCGFLQGAEAAHMLKANVEPQLCSRCLFGRPLGNGVEWLSWRRATPEHLRLVRRGPTLASVFFCWFGCSDGCSKCQLLQLRTPLLPFLQPSSNTVDLYPSDAAAEFAPKLLLLLNEMQRLASGMFGITSHPIGLNNGPLLHAALGKPLRPYEGQKGFFSLRFRCERGSALQFVTEVCQVVQVP